MMEHFYTNLVGWFDFEDVYRDQVEKAKDGDIFIEIGTANGKSASFMCVEIANSGKKIEFHTIDIFPEENKQWMQEENTRKVLSQFDFCHVHKSDSVEYLKSLKSESVDFIFIDGKHEIDPLMMEIELAYDKIKKKKYIGGHDYWVSFPDVKKCVNFFAKKYALKVEIFDKSWMINVGKKDLFNWNSR